MLIAAGTFALVVALIVGIYWFVLVRPEDRAQANLRKRLKSRRKISANRSELVKQVERLSQVPMLNSALARAKGTVGPLAAHHHRIWRQHHGGPLPVGVRFCRDVDIRRCVSTLAHQTIMGIVAGALAAAVPYGYLRYARA